MELILERGTILYSEEDHELISPYHWSISKSGYAYTCINGSQILMHRLVMKATINVPVDHINNNRIDNRRENLRLTNAVQNSQNKSKSTGKTSDFLGVSYVKSKKKYKVQIGIQGKKIFIGYYDGEIEAATARDLAIVHEYKDSSFKLNFPDDLEIYKTTKYVKRKRRKITPKSTKLIVKCFYENTNNRNIVRLLIKNSPNAHVLIDRNDYNLIKYQTYYINTSGYVISDNAIGGRHALHRFIMNVTDSSVFIDHIDGNRLNNTKNNLRHSNSTLNAQNRQKSISRNTNSIYMGVTYRADRKNWRSIITINKIKHILGDFKSEIAAALTRDLYIMKYVPNMHFKLNYHILNKEYMNDYNLVSYQENSVYQNTLIDDLDD